ncbi:monosaccharide ABC transporter substrate-binding protein, CUT2 family (TC 3.A.1.2.-) [Loktanella fryxellensis]|uniref:Monosaccharide ABC transporter substrate-binding protein, CUT2 family (TC 3.A.1.2.-) n=1 Tax=Loktanella fryxellensis TaxID=245187 RepID=A0A1H8BRC4_9RHOB|nr:substrate-binding domain-containing protein [Loktanella fryxellensis]SEM85322.1 monosaccharide ABC transporter substrate-binding protein, CUT2 family (TC 3.A.1.2.-) [Loktanella fryxellensis]
MNKSIIAAVIATVGFSSAAMAQDGMTVGVSWSNFQEERWKTDEAAIKEALEAAGATYISADAQASAAKQLTDIEALIAQGADALIVLAMDKDAIAPAIDQAANEGIPVVGYDRLIEDERAFYLTFDNRGVGTIIAQTVMDATPEGGNIAIIKGDPGDPNAGFLLEGMMEVVQPLVDAGTVTIAGEAFTDGWKPEGAQDNMEQILTSANNEIAAVLAQNDGMAGGAIAALASQGLDIPVGGQDGDLAALNRVARGDQTVSVWKNSRDLGKRAAEIAVAMAGGTAIDAIPEAQKWSGGENGVEMNAIFLAPTPITADNLNLAIDAGHITKEQACEGALDTVAACQ